MRSMAANCVSRDELSVLTRSRAADNSWQGHFAAEDSGFITHCSGDRRPLPGFDKSTWELRSGQPMIQSPRTSPGRSLFLGRSGVHLLVTVRHGAGRIHTRISDASPEGIDSRLCWMCRAKVDKAS
jgi:hypothetical protein